jgi:serine/threonine-protein kinase RsbW
MPHDIWMWQIEKSLPSDNGAAQKLLEKVLAQLEKCCWQDRDVFGVRLAMEEALINAIKHGNRLDQKKHVHVVCKLSPARIWIEIRDEGGGFDESSVPDPTAPEYVERDSGRGIMLMRNFMSRVEYNDAGNSVVMEKLRSADGAT